MIIYKYLENFFEDDPESEAFCKKHNIVYFKPSKKRKVWLKKWLKTAKLPRIECEPDIICYWRDFGTWGMYHSEDNSISICPYEIDKAGGLEEVIKHEIAHLKHPEADNMPHEKKEEYVEKSRKNKTSNK